MKPNSPDRFQRPAAPSAAINRRTALRRLGWWSALSLGLWPGSLSPKVRAGEDRFQFLVVNDLHHAAKECDPWFAALMQQKRTHRDAEFVLVCGDLADAAAPASLTSVRDHLRGLDRPFHVVIGNHDHAAGGDRRAFEQTFPGQLNYTFDHRGWQFVGLDTTQGVDWEKTRVQPATLTWLDEHLPKLDRRRPTVVFTHFPLASGVTMAPLNSEEVLRRFADFNLRGVFSGHYHAFTERQFGGVPVVTNRCCSRLRGNHDGSKEKGYWLVTANAGALSREFVAFNGTVAKA